ncbi:MAG TPA: hypothetical protein VLD62_07520 [Acidimicrobiia bacterium]|nr:hypothetical protein [Acidimicrobiia bacterium]
MTLALVRAVDGLYERAVLDAASLDDDTLGRWLEDVAASMEPPIDREVARCLRKAARTARRLARHWTDRDPGVLPDWRNGVDDALGSLGWRVQLDLARRGLALDPDRELYEEARERYRAVHFTEWPVRWEDIAG